MRFEWTNKEASECTKSCTWEMMSICCMRKINVKRICTSMQWKISTDSIVTVNQTERQTRVENRKKNSKINNGLHYLPSNMDYSFPLFAADNQHLTRSKCKLWRVRCKIFEKSIGNSNSLRIDDVNKIEICSFLTF